MSYVFLNALQVRAACVVQFSKLYLVCLLIEVNHLKTINREGLQQKKIEKRSKVIVFVSFPVQWHIIIRPLLLGSYTKSFVIKQLSAYQKTSKECHK